MNCNTTHYRANSSSVPGDPTELAARIEEALAHDILADLHISALQAADDGVRALLVEVHARVEIMPDDAAAALNERIWVELKESTRRRHLVTGI